MKLTVLISNYYQKMSKGCNHLKRAWDSLSTLKEYSELLFLQDMLSVIDSKKYGRMIFVVICTFPMVHEILEEFS